MRLVHLTTDNTLELNFMWLPTWLGINKSALSAIKDDIAAKVAGLPATEDNLDVIHERVVEVLAEKYPHIVGLKDYLDGLKFIQI